MKRLWKTIKDFFKITHFFAVMCTTLTLLLVYQELVNFIFTKPTTTSTEEKNLQNEDLPEVVVCAEPGFNLAVQESYGYGRHHYYRGFIGDKFVGWNGGKDEEKSSRQILDDIFAIKGLTLISDHEGGYSEDFVLMIKPNISTKILFHPYGRCLSVSPPQFDGNLNTLKVFFNSSYINHLGSFSEKLVLYFIDTKNSAEIYPDTFAMKGDPIEMRLDTQTLVHLSYETKITRSHHIPGDPLLDCTEYATEDNSFNDCIHNELIGFFHEKIGCAPPLLATESAMICNRKFNLSKEEDEDLKKKFRRIYFHSLSSKCKSPCTRNIFTSKMTHRIPDSDAAIFITFHPSIEVFQSRLSVDAQTLLTRLGGSISSGRTLLWILLSIFGAFQVPIFIHLWCFSGGNFHMLLLFAGVEDVPTIMRHWMYEALNV